MKEEPSTASAKIRSFKDLIKLKEIHTLLHGLIQRSKELLKIKPMCHIGNSEQNVTVPACRQTGDVLTITFFKGSQRLSFIHNSSF